MGCSDTVIEAQGGVVFKVIGDASQAAFPTAPSAIAAAVAAQRAFLTERWADPPGPLRVRMALHAGEATPDERGDYLAAPLNRLARLVGTTQGGQILLTESVEQLTQDDLPPDASLRDLGEILLRDLERPERVFALVHPDLPDDFLPLGPRESATYHFAASLTPFHGRVAEIATVMELLRTPGVRLVTLTGSGGTGKTRLAQEVGMRLAGEMRDGAVFVDLSALRDPALVLPEVALMLGLRGAPGRTLADVVHEFLRERELLLLLDNFEHLLEAAPVVSDLLAAASEVKVLAASRAPLRLRGEHEYSVPPLRLPGRAEGWDPAEVGTNEAVSFFVARAQAVRPAFKLTAENAPVVVEICHRLDGLPLALELAAARVKMLSPETLLARLTTRLPLLTGGSRDAPARQRTLRAAIAWSHDLLTSQEQTLFRRLSVFVGGWTLEAAEAVANLDGDLDVLEGLAALGDNSLVRFDESGLDSRYSMLETIREFAVEQLAARDDDGRVRDAHAEYMHGFAAQFDQAMFDPERRALLGRSESELANVRAALGWLEQRGDAEQLLNLAAKTWGMSWERVNETREWVQRGLTVPGSVAPDVRAKALGSAALSAWTQGDHTAAEVYAKAGLDVSQAHGLDVQAGLALNVLMLAAVERGAFAQAIAYGEDAIRHVRRSGNRRWLSQALLDAAVGAYLGGEAERAAALREEGFALGREVGNTWGIAAALSDMGAEAESRGDVRTALDQYRESLTLMHKLGGDAYFAHPLAGIASIAAIDGAMELAARLLGAVAYVHQMRGTTAFSYERARDDRTAALATAALGHERFDREFAAGRRLSMTEAVQQALDASAIIAKSLA